MMDIIACSPDSAHYLIDDVLRVGAVLIAGAKYLRNNYEFGTPQSVQKNTSDHSLPAAIPSKKTAPSIASKIQCPSMNQM